MAAEFTIAIKFDPTSAELLERAGELAKATAAAVLAGDTSPLVAAASGLLLHFVEGGLKVSERVPVLAAGAPPPEQMLTLASSG